VSAAFFGVPLQDPVNDKLHSSVLCSFVPRLESAGTYKLTITGESGPPLQMCGMTDANGVATSDATNMDCLNTENFGLSGGFAYGSTRGPGLLDAACRTNGPSTSSSAVDFEEERAFPRRRFRRNWILVERCQVRRQPLHHASSGSRSEMSPLPVLITITVRKEISS